MLSQIYRYTYAYIKEGKGEGNFFLSLCFFESIDILDMRVLTRKGKKFLSLCFLESVVACAYINED